MKLSEKIMILRKKQGWSQEELAERLDVSRQAVSKWESDQATPDVEKILRMSQIFGVSTDALLKDEVDIDSPQTGDIPPHQMPTPENGHMYGSLHNHRERRSAPAALTVFRSVFWPLVVALYLLYSFFTTDWGRSWIVWPVAAVLFTLVNVIWSTAAKAPIDED